MIRRGVVAGDLSRRIEEPAFTVFLPHGLVGHLCVSIESRDGHYRGEFDVEVPMRPGSDVVARRVALDTRYVSVWQKLKAGELAIDARLQSTCSPSEEATLVVASWNETVWPTTVTVLVNIADKEGRLVVPSAPNTERLPPVHCKRTSGGVAAVAYNAECRVTTAGRDLMGTVLKTSDGEIQGDTIRLKIALTSGVS